MWPELVSELPEKTLCGNVLFSDCTMRDVYWLRFKEKLQVCPCENTSTSLSDSWTSITPDLSLHLKSTCHLSAQHTDSAVISWRP